MKKVQKYLVFLVSIMMLTLGTLLIQSCEKDPKNPPPPPVTFTMTSIVNGKGLVTPDKLSEIKAGSNISIKFTPDSSYSLYSVINNEIRIIEIPISETETSYTFNNTQISLSIVANFVETDIVWFSVESIDKEPWRLTGIDYYNSITNEYFGSSVLSEAEKTDKYYFLYPSMDILVLELDGGVRSGKWDLKNKILKVGNVSYPITLLNKTMFKNKTDPIPVFGYGETFFVYAIFTYQKK